MSSVVCHIACSLMICCLFTKIIANVSPNPIAGTLTTFTFNYFSKKFHHKYLTGSSCMFDRCSKQSPGGVMKEKVFLEALQNLLGNTCARFSFLIKLQACLSRIPLSRTSTASNFTFGSFSIYCNISYNSFRYLRLNPLIHDGNKKVTHT